MLVTAVMDRLKLYVEALCVRAWQQPNNAYITCRDFLLAFPLPLPLQHC